MGNAVVAASILEFFEKNPKLHEQDIWLDDSDSIDDDLSEGDTTNTIQDFLKSEGCGTTRCVAGQAVIEARPDLLEVRSAGDMIFVELLRNLHWEVEGMKILGLERRDAHELFFNTSSDEAIEALTCIVNGEPFDWPKIYGNEHWVYPDESAYFSYWGDIPRV